MRSLKDQLNWSHYPTKILFTISNHARYSEQVRDTLRKRRETARRRTEIETIDGRRRSVRKRYKEETQNAKKSDRARWKKASNNSRFRISAVQSWREPMSPKRNLNLEPGLAVRYLHWRFSWNCLMTKRERREVCRPWCITRRVRL